MASKGKQPNKQNDKSSNTAKIILIAVVLIIAGYFVYTSLNKNDTIVRNTSVTDPREKIKNIPEPQFMKEGELEFLKKDGKTPIVKIDVEMAEDDRERAQGLMYRKSMDEKRGMLFTFTMETEQEFWMKNTIMSLDIIYVNHNMEIVKIYKHTTPFSESPLPSGKPAFYVVEVISGFTDKYGIKEGDMISYKKL